MFDLLWVPNFMKIGAKFRIGTKFARIYNLGSRFLISSIVFIISMLDLFWVPNFIKIGHIAILRPNLPKFLILSQRPVISNIFMINELDLLWLPSLIALGIYFIFGTNFFWNEGIDTCLMSNMYCLAVILICLVVTTRYWWLQLVTARSHFWYE